MMKKRNQYPCKQRISAAAVLCAPFLLMACQQPHAGDVAPSEPQATTQQPDTTQQPAGDSSPALRPSYDQCIDAAGGEMPAMQDCMVAEYGYQDARLNKAYQAAMVKAGKAAEDALRAEQKKWLAERDEQCYYDPDSGQGGRLEADECRLEMTATRAVKLEAL